MKKGFLFAAMACLLFTSLTSCSLDSRNYAINLSNKLQKTRMGESSIQNISKYTAIGVGAVDNKSPQKKYKLIDKENDEIDDTGDYSYILLGMTESGLIEELTFLAANGNEVSSSNFNITYYEEVGDFVLFSYLPISKEAYLDGFKKFMRNSFDYRDSTEEDINNAAQSLIIGPLNRLSHPIPYSFKTKNGFVDTSFLVHKQSGKIFPFSTHARYINISKMRGWLHNSVDADSEETNITAADIMMPYSEVRYWLPSYPFSHTNCFDNGFFVSNTSGGYYTFKCIQAVNEGLSVLRFNEETQNIDVNSITTVRTPENINNDSVANACDKWGNKFIKIVGDESNYYRYNLVSKKTTKIDDFFDFIRDLRFDTYTRQFFRVSEDAYLIFYNEDFEIDYRLNINIESDVWRTIYDFDTSYCIDKTNNIVWAGYNIIKLEFDENGHYKSNPYSIVSTPNRHIANTEYAYGNYYFAQDGNLYKVDVSNNYSINQISDIPYRINSIYMNDYDNLTFDGIDLSSLQQVTGYIDANDEATFEINTNSNKTTIFTPIN